jgi:phage terminase small subunit
MSALAEVLPPDVQARVSLRMPRRQRFVEEYLLCGSAVIAAERAGYHGTSLRRAAQRLLHTPEVAAAIEAGRKALAERNAFTVDKAMAQLQADRAFAVETKNATAAVRASELMAKMSGHLVDRIDARFQQIPLRIEISTVSPVLTPIEVTSDGGA